MLENMGVTVAADRSYEINAPAAVWIHEFQLKHGEGEAFDVGGRALCVIEWPERGALGLIQPDLHLRIAPVGDHREIDVESCSGWENLVLNEVLEGEQR